MGLTKPGDEPVVLAAFSEFMKLCETNGLDCAQICQVAILVAAYEITECAQADPTLVQKHLEEFERSLRSAIESAKGDKT